MKGFLVIFAVALLSPACRSRTVQELESVVSVYTTQSTTAGTNASLDVYHQIANNIAERITSPIYRFLGINTTKSEATTKLPFSQIELLDDQDISRKTDVKPITNDISSRDVEELSTVGPRRSEKKPEKITLYSSYLPVNGNLELNDTSNEIDDDDSFTLDDIDDVDEGKAESGDNYFIYVLEFFGSILQLLWGGFLALFNPSTPSESSRG